MKRIILASLLGAAAMLAAQTPKPAESATSNAAPAPASKTVATKKAKKHHKKASAVNSNTPAKPAASK